MKKLYFLLFFGLAPLLLWGQVSGVVVNSNGSPLIGVVVQNADGTVSTTTDFDGYFELSVPEGTQLEVAFLGYRSVNVPATKNMRIELREKGAKPKMPGKKEEIPWSVFILANGMSGIPFTPAVGLTIGMVRKGGWYVNFMTGFGFHFDDTDSYYGKVNYTGQYTTLPFYTGNKSNQTMAVTLGGLVRFGNAPVYMYLGAGWAYKSTTLETNNGKWVAYTTDPANNMSPMHSVALEAGLLANIKGFALSIGYEPMIGIGGRYSSKNAAHEIKIGLGGMFDCKRRTQK
jgi:hypothetical protein